MRATLLAILCCGVLVVAVSCSNLPAGPSATATPTAASAGAASDATASAHAVSHSRFGDRTPGVIYVSSQGLYYDTFVVKDPLPMTGQFQPLVDGTTEFGPGQPGYLGGRWWVDANGNGVQDEGDHFFLCPLLPPGRPTP
jgi:hypothetical protein